MSLSSPYLYLSIMKTWLLIILFLAVVIYVDNHGVPFINFTINF